MYVSGGGDLRNKIGFTLIELLAVIVILAIIALIATPIVLSIIKDSKESAQLRSAEMYLKGVETSIATSTLNNQKISNGTYNILKNGNVCLEYNEDKCINELAVEVNGETPTSGFVTIEKGEIVNIAIIFGKKTIVKNDKDEFVYNTGPCIAIKGNKNILGSKYICEVKTGVKYNFYVLSYEEDGTTNLIMDQNIYSDGSPSGKNFVLKSTNPNKYTSVAWNLNNPNSYGPTTVVEFLYNATKDWTNIPALNYIYKDREFQDSIFDYTGYISFEVVNGVATIHSLKGDITVIGTEQKPLRARLPIYSPRMDKSGTIKIEEKGDVSDRKEDNSNSYIYDNLSSYWTLSTHSGRDDVAYRVNTSGVVSIFSCKNDNGIGVRPVINVKL